LKIKLQKNGNWERDGNQEKRNQERQDGQEEDFCLERGMGNQTKYAKITNGFE